MLSEVVGGRRHLTRCEVVKWLWIYIREHNLKNPHKGQEILCDTKFKCIMGGRSVVTIFTMNKYINDHIGEKVDRTLYEEESKHFFDTVNHQAQQQPPLPPPQLLPRPSRVLPLMMIE
jgi:chromatin remodeling complex protein RSC6